MFKRVMAVALCMSLSAIAIGAEIKPLDIKEAPDKANSGLSTTVSVASVSAKVVGGQTELGVASVNISVPMESTITADAVLDHVLWYSQTYGGPSLQKVYLVQEGNKKFPIPGYVINTLADERTKTDSVLVQNIKKALAEWLAKDQRSETIKTGA
jgi:hypothetical protein